MHIKSVAVQNHSQFLTGSKPGTNIFLNSYHQQVAKTWLTGDALCAWTTNEEGNNVSVWHLQATSLPCTMLQKLLHHRIFLTKYVRLQTILFPLLKSTNKKKCNKIEIDSTNLIKLTGIRPFKIYKFLGKKYHRKSMPLVKYYRRQVVKQHQLFYHIALKKNEACNFLRTWHSMFFASSSKGVLF